MAKEVRIEERVKCEKCENETATLIKVLSTEKPRKSKKQKKEENEKWIYLENVLILVYECQRCGSKFDKIIRI